jgi:hypothetical protein
MNSNVSTRSLYRRLLRLAYRWPEDPLRPNANFSVALQQAIRSQFETSSINDKKVWSKHEITEHIKALEQLLNNQYKTEVSY